LVIAVRGIIFDIDGTLVDTNPAHVEAWRRAFKRFRFDIPAERIRVEIGGHRRLGEAGRKPD
jgi:beta-phosphoglucomutase-like phosphatase (HAD superfamily)